jgi:hypothetical protein
MTTKQSLFSRANLFRYGLEFGVVFVGVWLSLVAESMRQDQIEARAERGSLIRLAQDLESDIVDLKGNLARQTRQLEAANWLASRRGHVNVDESRVADALFKLPPCSMFIQNTAEYTMLLSSGELRLIRDNELRRQITDLYETRDFLHFLHREDCKASQELFTLAMPYVVLMDGDPNDALDWRTPRVREVLDADSLFADPNFMNKAVKLASEARFLVGWIENEMAKTAELLADIRQAVNSN